MNVLEKTTNYLLPKYLRNNPLQPEYEERYFNISGHIVACFAMLLLSLVLLGFHAFIAPYLLLNTITLTAVLLFSRSGLFYQANVAQAAMLYFLYFPVLMHTGGIYSVNLVVYHVMLFANMFTHLKWGPFFIIPAWTTVWLLYFFTPDSPAVDAVIGSKEYIAILHSGCFMLVVAAFFFSYKNRINQIIENKTVQNKTIHTLNDEVSRRTKELANMRQTLAADFHDETGNMLSAIIRQAALLKLQSDITPATPNIVEHIIANSNQLYASNRHFIWNLNNDSDDPHVLFNYLTSFGQVFYNQFDIAFSAENTVADASLRLEPFAAISLIFIFKEAMNNVVKHAEAKEVILKMRQKMEHLYFSLTDDGTWKERDTNNGHHGLSNMQKRCEQNGFLFSIDHLPRIGTRVEIGVPHFHKQPIENALV